MPEAPLSDLALYTARPTVRINGAEEERVTAQQMNFAVSITALFSGILGTGHHYFWIGMPAYWQWIGSIFSSFEVVPFFAIGEYKVWGATALVLSELVGKLLDR